MSKISGDVPRPLHVIAPAGRKAARGVRLSTVEVSRALLTLAAVLLLAVGLLVLRWAWVQRGRAIVRVIAGWCAIAAGLACSAFAHGEAGVIAGVGALSVLAYAIIAAGRERRSRRVVNERDLAAEPEERPTNWTRAIAKSLLAIVLAGVTAVGIGTAFAVAAPMDPVNRIVIGGLLVPMLWGAGMAWTLCDARLVRATVLLLTVSTCAYGIAFLPKMLSS